MSLGPEVSAEKAAHSVRRFRAASGEGLPFFPYGLLPVIGFALLTLAAWSGFAHHSIENVVRLTAERTILETGAQWASLDVSGQWVTVAGEPPTPEAGERLLSAIRTARAPTWFGLARPVTKVTGAFGAGTAGPGQASGSTPLLSANADTPEYLFRLSGARLTLDGRVPDIATRDAVIEAANTNRPPRIELVESNLDTIGIAAPDGFRDAALRGVETLKLCNSGTARLNALQFDLRCELPGSQAERVRSLASAPLAYGSVGEIQILAQEVVETCEEELTRLLEASRIEFDPGSDRIASSKAAVLDLTARAAADCPGTLRVEGHTDITGGAGINESLSRRRAEAVRAALIQRGVAPSRIIAAGYGSAQPLGDNATEAGRAMNRRIEIRILRADE
jgi:OmpA-OmpF porin, OOP family